MIKLCVHNDNYLILYAWLQTMSSTNNQTGVIPSLAKETTLVNHPHPPICAIKSAIVRKIDTVTYLILQYKSLSPSICLRSGELFLKAEEKKHHVWKTTGCLICVWS